MGIGRKRRREGGDLSRVAEIVMVLVAAGEARGGRAPTVAERALAAEARGALAAAVREVARPRELFQREAVRALVEDLRLTRATDPAAVGYLPRRASIADRVLLTKRKMEEVKEVLVHPTTNVPKTTASVAKPGFQHGACKSTTGPPRNLSTPMTAPFVLKLPLLNGTVAATTDQAKSDHHTATSLDQEYVQSSSQEGKSLDKRAHAIHPVTGSVVTGHQTPNGQFSVKKQSIFSNHKAIAKNIERILNQPVIHPSWAVPSTEYMNTQLNCQICKFPTTDMESLLVCDACERGVHLKCLWHYGDQGLPKIEWYCPTCVAHTRGKPLPPKYGKVTRTIVTPKTSMSSGVTQPYLQVAAENPTKRDSSKQVAANEGVTDQSPNKVGSTEHKSSTLALDTSLKSPSISAAGPQKENVKNDESSSIRKEGNGQPCGGILTEPANSYNEVESSGALTYVSGDLSGQSHMHIDGSSVNSVNYSTLRLTAVCGLKHSGHSPVVTSVVNCESTGNSYQHPSKQIPSTRMRTDETHQADEVANNGIENPHEQIIVYDAILDHGNAHQVASNGNICPEHEIIGDIKDECVGCSTASVVDWVGGALEGVDGKTYYNSCNIEGVIYNLHDHILIASEDSKSVPCKLESLWEEHESRSRLAMVNPYFFGSDIPESASKPCTDEENEVLF